VNIWEYCTYPVKRSRMFIYSTGLPSWPWRSRKQRGLQRLHACYSVNYYRSK